MLEPAFVLLWSQTLRSLPPVTEDEDMLVFNSILSPQKPEQCVCVSVCVCVHSGRNCRVEEKKLSATSFSVFCFLKCFFYHLAIADGPLSSSANVDVVLKAI